MPGIDDWLDRRAVSAAGHPALVFRGTRSSYRELAERVRALAGALADRGVGPGDRVAFLGPNHPAFIETLFAVARLGAVFVPLNLRLSAPELRYMLEDATPTVLVVAEELLGLGDAAATGLGLPRLVVADHATRDAGDDAPRDDDYGAAIASAPAPPERVEFPATDALLLIYTSGTTGRPKGAVLSRGAVVWNALNVIADYDVQSTDRVLMISPMFHVASLGMGCLPTLLKGGTVLIESRFVPGEALRTIQDQKATTLSGVPTTFQLMAEDPAWETTDISSLRSLTCGGSPVPPRVREAYESRGLAFSGGYGMTEAGPGVTLLAPSLAAGHPGSAGLPHAFTDVRIRDEDGLPAGPGEPGEIQVRSPSLFSGYWRLPEATAAAFTEDGWFRSGDVGVRDDDGFLFIVDRLKDMIISGGENIYSAEVEQAIMEIDGVTGVAVIGVPHERWGEVPHAVVTLASGRALDPEDMVAVLSTRLARYKVPRTLEVVSELPRTASGKVQKQLLRESYERSSR